MVPQGLMSPVMPLSYDVQRNGPVPMSTLASTLASATPENQRMVRSFLLFSFNSNFVVKENTRFQTEEAEFIYGKRKGEGNHKKMTK